MKPIHLLAIIGFTTALIAPIAAMTKGTDSNAFIVKTLLFHVPAQGAINVLPIAPIAPLAATHQAVCRISKACR